MIRQIRNTSSGRREEEGVGEWGSEGNRKGMGRGGGKHGEGESTGRGGGEDDGGGGGVGVGGKAREVRQGGRDREGEGTKGRVGRREKGWREG